MFDLSQSDAKGLGFAPIALARLTDHYRRYVDDGRLPFFQLAVTRHGRLAHYARHGLGDREIGRAVADDTILRIYSMTKPITAVAAMMLVEEGLIELTEPVARFLPAFAAPRVWIGGSAEKPVTAPARNAIQVRDLMRHTAGLSYAHGAHPVDDIYKARGYQYGGPPGRTLAAAVDEWATLPLLYEPGTNWAYSHATDVLGRLVEVVSGLPLDVFFAERILRPLGMHDTHFRVPEAKLGRLAALYRPDGAGGLARFAEIEREVVEGGRFLSGGGGLVATLSDYLRFAEMLRRGGDLDGVRLLGPRTLAYMTRNHLPGNADLQAFGRPLFAETPLSGIGFGLGMSVVVDPVRYGVTSSAGEFGWGGAASTTFLVDPVEDMTAVFMTQLIPSNTYPIRTQLRALLYSALN
jgi:CubicO group peptidase (beta-lactamase class C family)